MMINAWRLAGDAQRKPAWANIGSKRDIYAEGGYSAAKLAPFGVDNEPTNYSTNLRPQTSASSYQYQSMPSAGSTSWQVKTESSISGNVKA